MHTAVILLESNHTRYESLTPSHLPPRRLSPFQEKPPLAYRSVPYIMLIFCIMMITETLCGLPTWYKATPQSSLNSWAG
jgi:hypothetical protein